VLEATPRRSCPCCAATSTASMRLVPAEMPPLAGGVARATLR